MAVLVEAGPLEVGKMWFKKKLREEVDLDCPRCFEPMKKVKKHDVIIDVCERCQGMWLDDGEIEKLAKMRYPHGKEKAK